MGEAVIPAARPHGELVELFNNVFFIAGSVRMSALVPMSFSRNMTVIREGQNLTLINSIRLDDRGLAALDKLGSVVNVIRIAGFHGVDDPFYKDRYNAKILAVEGQSYARGIKPEPKPADIYFAPDVEINQDSELPIQGSSLYVLHTAKPPEALVVLDRDGGILVSGDCLQNWGATDQYFSFLAKPMMKMMGFIKPYNIGPAWLRVAKPDGREIRGILDLPFDHVLPAHGEPVIGDAKERYRAAITKIAGASR